jgi:hypothetical protein
MRTIHAMSKIIRRVESTKGGVTLLFTPHL